MTTAVSDGPAILIGARHDHRQAWIVGIRTNMKFFHGQGFLAVRVCRAFQATATTGLTQTRNAVALSGGLLATMLYWCFCRRPKGPRGRAQTGGAGAFTPGRRTVCGFHRLSPAMVTATMTKKLIDDCFVPGQPRLRHAEALAILKQRIAPVVALERGWNSRMPPVASSRNPVVAAPASTGAHQFRG